MAVDRPDARAVAVDDRVPALARVHAQRVRLERRGPERRPVARHDVHPVAVRVPRVRRDALVHEPEQHLVALLGDDRRGRREAMAVDREPAQHVAVDEHDLLRHAVLARVAVRRPPRLDDEGAQEAAAHLVGRVVQRVVHVRARGRGRELVGERVARHDRQLGEERDAVLGELVDRDAVEVDAGRVRHVVGDRDPDAVALDDADRRPGPGLVEPEGLHRRQEGVDRPVDLVGREREDLGPVDVDADRLERLVALDDLGELGVVGVRSEDVVEELGHAERPGEVADEPAHPHLGVVVGLRPAGREVRDRWRRRARRGPGRRRLRRRRDGRRRRRRRGGRRERPRRGGRGLTGGQRRGHAGDADDAGRAQESPARDGVVRGLDGFGGRFCGGVHGRAPAGLTMGAIRSALLLGCHRWRMTSSRGAGSSG